jgi:hypothetical protein
VNRSSVAPDGAAPPARDPRREGAGGAPPAPAARYDLAALTLYEANEAYCRADPWRGRETKINTYAGSVAARAVVGQLRSTVDPAAWVREGRLVIVNGAKGRVGEGTAALIGGTLLNLVDLAIGAQVALPPTERRPVTVIVDEFHTMPGADYESLLAEQGKYGANVILATQSLARLEARDPERALRAIVFANLDGLFAFHCSAEDAEYLIPELGAPVTVEDLTGLGEHRCYARLSSGRERLAPFLVDLLPPPPGDAATAEALAAASAARWGRPRAAVEADYAAALARIAATRRYEPMKTVIGQSGTGLRHDPQRPQPEATRSPAGKGAKPARNEHRRPRPEPAPEQAALFAPPPAGGVATVVAPDECRPGDGRRDSADVREVET